MPIHLQTSGKMTDSIAPEPIREYEKIPSRGGIFQRIKSANIISNKNLLQLTYYNKKGDYEDSLLFDPSEIKQIEKKYLNAFARINLLRT